MGSHRRRFRVTGRSGPGLSPSEGCGGGCRAVSYAPDSTSTRGERSVSTTGQRTAPCRPRSGPYADQPPTACPHRGRSCWSAATGGVYHQHSKNLLVSYSPKRIGFFQRQGMGRLARRNTRQAPLSACDWIASRNAPSLPMQPTGIPALTSCSGPFPGQNAGQASSTDVVGPCSDMESGKDVRDAVVDGPFRDDQPVGDLAMGQPLHQGSLLAFARREICRSAHRDPGP